MADVVSPSPYTPGATFDPVPDTDILLNGGVAVTTNMLLSAILLQLRILVDAAVEQGGR